MIDRLEKKHCTGCGACVDICPVDAIHTELSYDGFFYPQIDSSVCIKCNRCEMACPLLCSGSGEKEHYNNRYFSAASKQGKIRDKSTSGGVFFELAAKILEEGGLVAGVSYSDDYKSAHHILIDNIDDLPLLMTTKYFQCDTMGIFGKVKFALDEGKTVMFSGTPCQNAALRSYLGKDYNNLFQMDFVCNSISSPIAYKKFLEELEQKYNSKVKNVRFKDKSYGWKRLAFSITFENGKVHTEDIFNSMWAKGLNNYNLYQRLSCYECQFRHFPNYYSDITVGDFWGDSEIDPYDAYKGLSFLVINSVKGEKLFNSIKDRIFLKSRKMEEIVKGNVRAKEDPVLDNEKRNRFFALLEHHPFSYCVEKSVGKNKDRTPEKNILKHAKKIIKYLIKGMSLNKYIYYNYFCRNIVREGYGEIIPFRNSIINISKTAKIIIKGNGDLRLGYNKCKGSKAECYITLEDNAKWIVRNGGLFSYNTTFQIKKNAFIDMGFLGLGVGSVVISQQSIVFGEGVICGRGCYFMDSDFHQLLTRYGAHYNPPMSITIGDHVWFSGDIRVLKGVTIGDNSIIGPNVVIKQNIPDNSFVNLDESCISVIQNKGNWSYKETVRREEHENKR